MRIALQQNTVWLIQFSFVKDIPSETDDRKGAGLCGEWKALWRVATLCLKRCLSTKRKPITRHVLDAEAVNLAFDVIKDNIYQKGGKLYGMKVFPNNKKESPK